MATKSLTFDIFGRDRSASKTIRGVGDAADDTSGRFRGMGVAAAAGLAIAAGAAVRFGVDSVKAYAEAEQSQNKLAFAYEKFPSLADTNIDAMRRLNEELAKKTRYDDDAYAVGQAQLAQYGLTGQQIMELTPLLADYAGKTGKDIPTAAEDLGKALLGQGRALKDIGIDFQDTGTLAGNLDAIMSGLRGQVGGFAEQDATTAAGKLDILKNKFGEVQEAVGAELLDPLTEVMDTLSESGALEGTATAVGDIASAFSDLEKDTGWISGFVSDMGGFGDMVDDIKKVSDWFANGGITTEKNRDVMDDNLIEGGGLIGGMVSWSRDMEAWWAGLGQDQDEWASGFNAKWQKSWGDAKTSTDTGMSGVRGGMGGGFSGMGMDLDAFGVDANGRLSSTWSTAQAGATTGMSGVSGNVGSGLGGVLGQIFGWSGQVGPQFGSAWSGANSQTVSGWGGIEGSTSAGVGRVGARVGEIPGVVKAPFAGAGSWLTAAGGNIVDGLIGGISGMIGSAAQAAARLAAATVNAAKSALGIQSPSTVFRDQVGKQIGSGLALGILAQEGLVTDAVDRLSNTPSDVVGLAASARVSAMGGGSASSVRTSDLDGTRLMLVVDGQPIEAVIRRQASVVVTAAERTATRATQRGSNGF